MIRSGIAIACALIAACSSSHVAAPTADASVDGARCSAGAVLCGGRCVDSSRDDDHCGACGRACAPGDRCMAGACAPSCGDGLVACGARCTDVAHDPSSCGACDRACDPGEICGDGECRLSCLGGSTRCGDLCVDVAHDPSHCGACGVACAAHEICTGSACTAICPIGAAACSGACVDPLTDPAHCGACDHACPPDHLCEAGACVLSCAPTLAACGDRCADTASDAAHCGGCDLACAPTEICDGGACACPTAWTRCTGSCVDTQTDPTSCGACGHTCATGSRCAAGACVDSTAEWPTLGGGPSRSGLNAGESGVPPLTRAWGIAAAAWELRPVATGSGLVFVTAAGRFATMNEIIALDLVSGTRVWSYDFGDASSVGQPTWDSGRVFVQQNKGTSPSTTNLYAFDALTGTVLWRSRFGSQWETFWSPLVVGRSVFIDGGTYGGLYGFDASDGRELFFFSGLEQYDEWAPAWHDGSVYTFVEGHLRAHDPASGAVTRTTSVTWSWRGWSMRTSPVFDGGRAFVIAPPTLHGIDASTGAILWSVSGTFTGMPAAAGGRVLALSGGALVSRDAATGTLQWTFVGDGSLSHPPVLTATHAYVASDSNTYAVDVATGTMAWTAATGGWVSVGANHLFVAGPTGTLTAYRFGP